MKFHHSLERGYRKHHSSTYSIHIRSFWARKGIDKVYIISQTQRLKRKY